jgi:hypothetical protein
LPGKGSGWAAGSQQRCGFSWNIMSLVLAPDFLLLVALTPCVCTKLSAHEAQVAPSRRPLGGVYVQSICNIL